MNGSVTQYWYESCPKCDHQGRLFLCEDRTQNRIYLHCEECEAGYFDPNDISKESSILMLLVDIESEPATLKRIKELGWEEYAAHEVTA